MPAIQRRGRRHWASYAAVASCCCLLGLFASTLAAASSESSPPPSSFGSPSGSNPQGGGGDDGSAAGAPSTPAFSSSSSPPPNGGGGGGDYASLCEGVKCRIVEDYAAKIEELRKTVVEERTCVPTFGVRSDEICNKALEDFASRAPDAGDDSAAAATYDRKLEELETALDDKLQLLYVRQLAFLRERALQKYRAAGRTTESSDYEAMLQADAQFAREAEEATREGSDWDYASDRAHLQAVMNDLASSGKRLVDVQLKGAQQQSTAMQYLQQQQQMIQQLQMQLYGQTSPWNVGVAYRIPDTNFNLQGAYQQGRTNVQLSCVPDEYASMLGPNGFTNGVGPGNLGLSLNLSI